MHQSAKQPIKNELLELNTQKWRLLREQLPASNF